MDKITSDKLSGIERAEKEFEDCLKQTSNLELIEKYVKFKTLMALRLDTIAERLDNMNFKASKQCKITYGNLSQE